MNPPSPETLKTAREYMTTVRGIIDVNLPYWSDEFAALILLWDDKVPTAGVTARGQLMVNPTRFIQWAEESIDHCSFVIAHEGLHVVLGHWERVGDRDHTRWNMACDYFINDLLRRLDWDTPEWVLLPEKGKDAKGRPLPSGLTAEEYYDLITEAEENESQSDGSESDSQSEQSESDSQGESQSDESDSQEDSQGDESDSQSEQSESDSQGESQGDESESDSDGESEEIPRPCNGQCGTGAGGDPLSDASGQSVEPEEGEYGDDGERNADELRDIEHRAAEHLREAIEKNTDGGMGSAGLDRWVKARLTPAKVSWTYLLKMHGKKVTSRGSRGKRSYRRPHRRQFCTYSHPRDPVIPIRERKAVVTRK